MTYKQLYGKNTVDSWEDFGDFYDHTERKGEYWELDHNTMKYFEAIEEIEPPNDWEDLNMRELDRYRYHSQYKEYNNQCYQLVRTKLGEYLDELLFILSRAYDKNNARKERNFDDALSQGCRYK